MRLFKRWAAMCHIRTCRLFDHLVGAAEYRRRHVEAERLGSFQIDHQLVTLVGPQAGRRASRP
jgi:hypothetical protein